MLDRQEESMAANRRDIFRAAVALGATLGPARPARASQAPPPATDEALRAALKGVLGRMPQREPAQVSVLESTRIAGGRRDKIRFRVERADPALGTAEDYVSAYLFVPDHAPGTLLPAILAIHQDGPQSHIGKAEVAGLAGDPELFYGVELFRRGYVVLCPDRFPHAERRRVEPNDLTSIDPDRDDRLLDHRVGQLLLRGRTFIGKEVHDLNVATDVLAALPMVDSSRIGSLGHSAGGLMAMFHMFADERIRAGVSSCGVFGFNEFYREDAPKRRAAAIALPGLLEVGDSGDVLALISPRPILLTRGLWEWGGDERWAPFSERHVEDTRRLEARARRRHGIGAGSTLTTVYFDENGGGHALPPGVKAEVYAWLDRRLDHRPADG